MADLAFSASLATDRFEAALDRLESRAAKTSERVESVFKFAVVGYAAKRAFGMAEQAIDDYAKKNDYVENGLSRVSSALGRLRDDIARDLTAPFAEASGEVVELIEHIRELRNGMVNELGGMGGLGGLFDLNGEGYIAGSIDKLAEQDGVAAAMKAQERQTRMQAQILMAQRRLQGPNGIYGELEDLTSENTGNPFGAREAQAARKRDATLKELQKIASETKYDTTLEQGLVQTRYHLEIEKITNERVREGRKFISGSRGLGADALAGRGDEQGARIERLGDSLEQRLRDIEGSGMEPGLKESLVRQTLMTGNTLLKQAGDPERGAARALGGGVAGVTGQIAAAILGGRGASGETPAARAARMQVELQKVANDILKQIADGVKRQQMGYQN